MPPESTAGLKTPVPEAKAGVHDPPVSGVPPNALNKSNGLSTSQISILPLVPGSGLSTTMANTGNRPTLSHGGSDEVA